MLSNAIYLKGGRRREGRDRGRKEGKRKKSSKDSKFVVSFFFYKNLVIAT